MKEKLKVLLVFVMGLLLSSGIVYAATLYTATEVSYDNSNSGTSKTNVQGALDELYHLSKKSLLISVSPSTPTYTGKEGELVVVSSVATTQYYISNGEPQNPVENSIWLMESNEEVYQVSTTNVVFFILKVKQYINSTWVDVPCYLYQNGKWVLILEQVYSFDYTGGVQSFTVPATGTYKLEVWGSAGACYKAGYGGYSVGYIELNAGDVLYVVCGGQPYNGGGAAWGANFDMSQWGWDSYDWDGVGPGGGATHIALNSNRGELKNYDSYRSEILIVAGGGASADDENDGSKAGGAGGGLEGVSKGGAGGTQTTGNAFGQGATASGGGWYGGKYNFENGSGGGSGYIGGVTSWSGNAPSTTAGQNSGTGKAKITLVQAG